jgi:hypothetical protein
VLLGIVAESILPAVIGITTLCHPHDLNRSPLCRSKP